MRFNKQEGLEQVEIPENQAGLDVLPLICSKCGSEVTPEEPPWPALCLSCQRPFDLEAQFAFNRGQDAFTAGQDLIHLISPKTRSRSLTTDLEMEGLQYYLQAYTAIQEAFKGDLSRSQHLLGVQMMTAMATVFMQHNMVSPLESAYWGNLLLEMNSQQERSTLLEKLAGKPQNGLMERIQRFRWRVRMRQLEKALSEVDEKIQTLERNIAFVDPPRVRRKLS